MNKTLFQHNLFKTLTVTNRRLIGKVNKSTTAADEPEEEETPVLFDDDDSELREEILQNNRNKSRLLPQHRNMVKGMVPYDEPQSWIHTTVKYQRMMFGKYGLASGVDPRICFYSQKELDEQKGYERVAFPFTLQEMMKANEATRIEKEAAIRKREDDIAQKLKKLDTWTKELQAKIAKKEAEAKAAKDRKERLIEEVRRHFGFKLDSRDERFKELLAQKEKEDKKQLKEQRRKLKEEKMLAKLEERNKEKENAEAPTS